METKLSTRLRLLRKSIYLSTSEVIDKLKEESLDYCEQSLYKWEEGYAIPSITTLYALAKIYHCNISYLIADAELEFKEVPSYERIILRLYRTDFLFRSTVGQLMRYINKTKR